MTFTRLLVANRAEIAVRIIRAAGEAKIPSVAVYAEDDAACLHVAMADEAYRLPGIGAGAYLSVDAIVNAARKTGSDAVHPGYGFLSEVPEFAEACAVAGITFVGPSPQNLRDF